MGDINNSGHWMRDNNITVANQGDEQDHYGGRLRNVARNPLDPPETGRGNGTITCRLGTRVYRIVSSLCIFKVRLVPEPGARLLAHVSYFRTRCLVYQDLY